MFGPSGEIAVRGDGEAGNVGLISLKILINDGGTRTPRATEKDEPHASEELPGEWPMIGIFSEKNDPNLPEGSQMEGSI